MALKTKDIDLGYKALLKEVEKVKKNPHVDIGIRGNEAKAVHPSSKDNPVTIADVGTFNEFGTRNIPERSFIRSTMDENRPELLQDNQRLFEMIALGKMTTERALKFLGTKIKSLIQKKITNLRTPPNAPSTIQRKKSSNPLIDTGTMRQSITYKVRMDGRDEAA